ncbi:MAG: DUF2283 domain-containing protein [Anaerolineales bacterium]|nr:DUF2283 domain-containing protein [Anaerolineales bacterium]
MTTTKVKKNYDDESDIFYIEFKPTRSAKGIQLTENIVLRIDPSSGEALGLAIHNYTKIAASGVADPLTGLPTTGNQTILQILTSKPLNNFLVLQRGAVTLGPALLPHAAKAA